MLDVDIYSTQITPSRQHYLYYLFSTAWITFKLFGTCYSLICAMVLSTAFCIALTGWTNTGSLGDIRSSGTSGGPGTPGASGTHTFRLSVLDGTMLTVSWIKMSVLKEKVLFVIHLYGLIFTS